LPGKATQGRASTGPGRRLLAGPRLERVGAAGPGLDWPGSRRDGALGPGLDWPGWRRRAGPRLAGMAPPGRPCSGRLDGAIQPARNAARERQYLVKRLWNECDGFPVRGTASQDPEPSSRTREFGEAGRKNCAHLSSNQQNQRTLEFESQKLCALSEMDLKKWCADSQKV
jgi:hypothetical protein